jgi:adenylosuccinate synthase
MSLILSEMAMRRAVVTIGLGFGDEAKGATVDKVCRELHADLVVRYCGGCQAAHNVILPDGTHHTFSQFGSGSLHHVPTYIGPDVIISPFFMVNEAKHLSELGLNPWKLLSVDQECLITTPYHQSLNRTLECKRGDDRHGSCGLGIGTTREHSILQPDDALRLKDLRVLSYSGRKAAIGKLKKIQQWASKQAGAPVEEYLDPDSLYIHLVDASLKINVVEKMPDFKMAVFEGAQGMLLDENHGYHPHTTWSTVTLKHAGELLRGSDTEVNVMGCIRAYMTRHGAGTFLSHDQNMMADALNIDIGNPPNEWQGRMRYGLLDLNVLAYSKAALGGQLHNISLSCLDHVSRLIPVLDGDIKHVGYIELKKMIEQTLAPIVVTGRGPTYADRQMGELSWYPLEEAIEIDG